MYTNRRFGIEIEFVGATHSAVEIALRLEGIDARAEHYNHNTTNHWKIVSDASLSHRSGLTGELVSPILQGEEGFRQLRVVCDVLNNLSGCTVNRTCGLHVHLDCLDMTTLEIAKVWERYATYEEQIDMIMPMSRRGEARWCRSVKSHKDCMKACETKQSQARAMDRYRKVNLTNIASRGAMEFRQHSGTTEFRKIANWTMFLMQFVEASIAISRQPATTKKARYFNEVRNLFENNDMTVEWRRGVNHWEIRRASTNRLLGVMTSDEMSILYRSNDRRVVLNNQDNPHNVRISLAYQKAFELLNQETSGDRNWVADNYANAVCNEAQDNGWMHGVCQNLQDYFEERYEELN